MWGGAYFGYTQWVLADRLDAGHTALLIQEASTDFYSTFYPGGAFALESALYWALRSHGDTDHVVTEDQLRRGADGLPTLEADNRALLNVDFFDEWAPILSVMTFGIRSTERVALPVFSRPCC